MMILLAAFAGAAAQVAQPDIVLGRWETPTRHGVVEIVRCGASICGNLLDSDGLRENPDLRDANNKDPELRERKLRNLQIMQGFSWEKGSWSGGVIYNAQDGGVYNATVTPVDSDHLTLKGCIVWPLCKTQHWKRVR